VPGFYQFSKPKKGEGDIFGKYLEDLYEKSRPTFVEIDEEYANTSLQDAVSFTREISKKYGIAEYPEYLGDTKNDTIISKLMQTANILQSTLGVVSFLVGEKEEVSK
jgi:hypothetical protein